MSDTRPLRAASAEFIGTFFLVLIGPGAGVVDAWSHGAIGHVGVSLAFGFVVTAMVFAFGPISGAHINPAVTLGLWSAGRFPLRSVPAYLVAQCLGATAAAAVLRGVLGDFVAAAATVPAIGVPGAFAVEVLLSVALMLVVAAATNPSRPANGGAPIAIGLTIAFCALVGGPLTGASMNPARSLGPAIIAGSWAGHWIYWLAPIGGTMLASRVYALHVND